ncbi:hypothetical protein QR680_010565 [Steinernema hermaphroditum]|uniref:Uncharacterized protein n=1 Tax=Steinernema hermaphroditum TaxID=289476 RepID=A0AA39MC15_9BILA|nr:hypothetical protein QR680_010565 [Steinernema hermaphroditum]
MLALFKRKKRERIYKVEIAVTLWSGLKIRLMDKNSNVLDGRLDDIEAELIQLTSEGVQKAGYQTVPLNDSACKHVLRVCRRSSVFYAGNEWSPFKLKILQSAVKGGKLEDVVLGNLAGSSSALQKVLMAIVKQGIWRRMWILTEMDLKFVQNVVMWWKKRDPDQKNRIFACEVPLSFEASMIYSQCRKDNGVSVIVHPKASSSVMQIHWEKRMIVIEFNPSPIADVINVNLNV